MIAGIRKLLRDWFTGPDNSHYEMGRGLWFLSVIAALIYPGAHLYLNGQFDVMDFGLSLAALLAAGGFGVSVKDKGSSEARKAP